MGLGEVLGLGSGDVLGLGSGDVLGLGSGDVLGLGSGDVLGLGSGDVLGLGSGDTLGDGDGDAVIRSHIASSGLICDALSMVIVVGSAKVGMVSPPVSIAAVPVGDTKTMFEF